MTIGQILRARREAQGLTLSRMSKKMGGSPNMGWLSRIENDLSEPGNSLAPRLADVLRLDQTDLMNAFGLATEWQRKEATERLTILVKRPPEPMPIALVDDHGDPTGRTISATAPPNEEVVAVELGDPEYRDPILVSRSRRCRDGDIAVAWVEGHLKVGRYRSAGNRRRWLQTREGELLAIIPMGVVIGHG